MTTITKPAKTELTTVTLIHKYGLGQWRTVRYLKTVKNLSVAGYLPTDALLTASLDVSTRSGLQTVMRNLESLNLVAPLHKTSSHGSAWNLTAHGEECYKDILKVEKALRASGILVYNE